MKYLKTTICFMALILIASSCTMRINKQSEKEARPEVGEQEPVAYTTSYAFFDEDVLIEAISDSYANREVATTDGIGYDMQNSTTTDIHNLSLITEFYKPKSIPNNLEFKEISVKDDYVSYVYVNENGEEAASFTWYRRMSPEVAMNELYDRGAISVSEVVVDEIKYVFLEWFDPEVSQTAGYSIHWVCEGRAYQAFMYAGYSEKEMLDFCQIETVVVR